LTAPELGPQEPAQARSKAIAALLTRHAGKGNVALVTHRPNVGALTMEIIEEGEAVVAKIQLSAELEPVGRISFLSRP
jgi:phosphohistidine phosphatase SixA